MVPASVSENYVVFNLSNKWSAYGYMYYASISAGESYAILYIQSILSILGIFVTVFIIAIHLCAIWFAQKHLYRTVHERIRKPENKTPMINQSWFKFDEIVRTHSPSRNGFRLLPENPNTVVMHDSNQQIKQLTSPPPPKNPNFVTIAENPSETPLPVLCETITYPGVSIIKPLAGIDNNIANNLRSYFMLDYPVYEILFCVAEVTDPVCELVRTIQSDYPHIQSRLITAEQKVGVNPKINNLQAGYNAAYYELLLISDAGIWMRPDTLTDMVSTMQEDEKNGLIHQVPFLKPYFGDFDATRGSPGRFRPEFCETTPNSIRPSFVWIVQLVFFGCWHAKIYLSAALFGINCTTGMSCLIRKSVILPIGGFKQFACYLAEDFFLSKFCISTGWKVRISHQPAWQNSLSGSLLQFQSRINRWTQLRLSMVPLAYFFEPLTRLLPNAIISSLSMTYLFPTFVDPGVYTLCLSLLWFLLDYLMLRCVYPPHAPLIVTKLDFLAAWLYSELTVIPFHLMVFFKKQLTWRNQRFRLRWGGLTEALPAESTPTTRGEDSSDSGRLDV